ARLIQFFVQIFLFAGSVFSDFGSIAANRKIKSRQQNFLYHAKQRTDTYGQLIIPPIGPQLPPFLYTPLPAGTAGVMVGEGFLIGNVIEFPIFGVYNPVSMLAYGPPIGTILTLVFLIGIVTIAATALLNSDGTVDGLINDPDTKPGNPPITSHGPQYVRPGGYDGAVEDFADLNPTIQIDDHEGAIIGQTADGKTVTLRKSSTSGEPTISVKNADGTAGGVFRYPNSF
ncbi:MAG: hypothetical protein SFY67_10430, partial [Candidatus Melainabacteria bacterium]|nr:hypothetical protein [Candidatus Melainabacteria bacterium]